MITGAQVRAGRALIGLDQRALAALAGLSLPTIQRMEKSPDSVRVVVDSLERVLRAFAAVGVELIPDGAPSLGSGRGVRMIERLPAWLPEEKTCRDPPESRDQVQVRTVPDQPGAGNAPGAGPGGGSGLAPRVDPSLGRGAALGVGPRSDSQPAPGASATSPLSGPMQGVGS